MLSTEGCGGKWHESLKACCAVLPRSNGEGDSQGVRSLKGKSIWQVISSMVHLWTVPPLPQINLHKRNDTQNVWSLTTSFVLHLCLEPSSCRCKMYIFAQIHDESTDLIFGPRQRAYLLGWCIFRAGFKSLEQRHMYKRKVCCSGWWSSYSSVILPKSWKWRHKLSLISSCRNHDSAAESFWLTHALCTQCLLLLHAFSLLIQIFFRG